MALFTSIYPQILQMLSAEESSKILVDYRYSVPKQVKYERSKSQSHNKHNSLIAEKEFSDRSDRLIACLMSRDSLYGQF